MEYNTGLLEIVGNDPHAYMHIWREWKQINPGTRIELVMYHEVNLAQIGAIPPPVPVSVPRDGLKALAMRKFGKWLKKAEWVKRGMRNEYGMIPIYDYSQETIRLKMFGWNHYENEKQIAFGYHAQSDTLYVKR